jgi:hypothetical protein
MWFYNTQAINSIEDMPFNTFGFIYKIINKETGKFYIGKKYIIHNIKKKITKKELAEQTGPGRRSTTKKIQKESDWKEYYGSSKELKSDIELYGVDKFERIILKFCFSSKQLNYWETSYQFKEDVLIVDSYCDNIAGRYFRKDLL